MKPIRVLRKTDNALRRRIKSMYDTVKREELTNTSFRDYMGWTDAELEHWLRTNEYPADPTEVAKSLREETIRATAKLLMELGNDKLREVRNEMLSGDSDEEKLETIYQILNRSDP